MSNIVVLSQQLSDIALNLSQNERSEFFQYSLPNPLPSYSLSTTNVRTSDTLAVGQAVRVILPTLGLLAPVPIIARWKDSFKLLITVANANPNPYHILFCFRSIDFRSNGSVIYSLTPAAILQFMSMTLAPTAYNQWLSYISGTAIPATADTGAERTISRNCVLPLLLPGFTTASGLLDLKRSQNQYDLLFTMAPTTEWAGAAAGTAGASGAVPYSQVESMVLDMSYIDLSEKDDTNYVESSYSKADSSLTKAQFLMLSDPAVVYTAGTAYPLQKARVIEAIHFYFYTSATNGVPLSVANSLGGTVSLNLGGGTMTIPIESLQAQQIFMNGRNYAAGTADFVYTINLSLIKNDAGFTGGLAAKSAANAYISFTGLANTPGFVRIFYSAKSVFRFSALSGVATEVSTS